MIPSYDEFLGSIRTLLKGSGILEAFQTEYEKNVAEYLMSGKAVTRTIRGNCITSLAQFTKLLSPIFPASSNQSNTQPGNNIYENNVRM